MPSRKQRKSQEKLETTPTLAEDLSSLSETQLEMVNLMTSEMIIRDSLSMIQRKAARLRMTQASNLKLSQNPTELEQKDKPIS